MNLSIDPYNTQWKNFTGSSPIEVYEASIENEVGRPAFATEKGSLWEKHKLGHTEILTVNTDIRTINGG